MSTGNIRGIGPIPWVVFAVLFVAVFLFAVLTAMLVTFIMPESYAGTARIKLEPAAATDSQVPQPSYLPQLVQTESEVIQSELILGRVVAALDLNTVWGRKYMIDQDLKTIESIGLIKGRLKLTPVRGTSLIEIRTFSDAPDEAAALANAIARVYADHAAQSGAVRVEVVDNAHPPIRPVRPNKRRNLAFGALIGGAGGLAIGGIGSWLTVLIVRKYRAT